LQVVTSAHEHRFHHRPAGARLRRPDEPNLRVYCACGCGVGFFHYDGAGRPRMYLSGHNSASRQPTANAIKTAIAQGCGTPDRIVRATGKSYRGVVIVLSRLARRGEIVRVKRGHYAPPGAQVRTNEVICCACGCQQTLWRYDKCWRERRYISGHNARGKQRGQS
jgi:hypothetical protein